jgi:hypothetical protein
MKFRTKDLLVSVLPKAELDAADIAKICALHTRICFSPTLCVGGTFQCRPCTLVVTCACTFRGTFGCGAFNSCGPDGSVCDPTIFCAGASEPWIIEDLEDLVTLRKELKDTLARLDEVERGGQLGIRTKADAEVLERSLTEALEQVKKAKANLK